MRSTNLIHELIASSDTAVAKELLYSFRSKIFMISLFFSPSLEPIKEDYVYLYVGMKTAVDMSEKKFQLMQKLH